MGGDRCESEKLDREKMKMDTKGMCSPCMGLMMNVYGPNGLDSLEDDAMEKACAADGPIDKFKKGCAAKDFDEFIAPNMGGDDEEHGDGDDGGRRLDGHEKKKEMMTKAMLDGQLACLCALSAIPGVDMGDDGDDGHDNHDGHDHDGGGRGGDDSGGPPRCVSACNEKICCGSEICESCSTDSCSEGDLARINSKCSDRRLTDGAEVKATCADIAAFKASDCTDEGMADGHDGRERGSNDKGRSRRYVRRHVRTLLLMQQRTCEDCLCNVDRYCSHQAIPSSVSACQFRPAFYWRRI